MKIVNIGSCRQKSLNNYFVVFNVNELISYPHYSKEILEVINFCLYGNLTPDETLYMFRSPLLQKKPILINNNIKNTFLEGDVYVIEIACNKTYEYNNRYLHHIAIDTAADTNVKTNIINRIQTYEEIEEDIIKIKKLLNKPLVIVGHLVTYNKGPRFLLSEQLSSICDKHNILFINPVNELKKNNINLNKCFVPEPILAHYTDYGEKEMGKIYFKKIKNYIDKNG